MNDDSYCEANLREFYLRHATRGSNATLLRTKVLDTGRFGQVEVSPDGKLTALQEKDSYLINRDWLEEIPRHRVSLEREVFPIWIDRGLYGFQSEARFVDIGTPDSHASAQSFFATGLSR
jgi:NDP-sugar pyrophosphorylase family protein